MSVLEKVMTLSPRKLQEVENFIDYIMNKPEADFDIPKEDLAAKRKRNMGWAKGQIWMADDFNDTPDDFKDYL